MEWVTILKESVTAAGGFQGVDEGVNPAAKPIDFFDNLQDRAIWFPKAKSTLLETRETVKVSETLAGLEAVGPEWMALWMRQWKWPAWSSCPEAKRSFDMDRFSPFQSSPMRPLPQASVKRGLNRWALSTRGCPTLPYPSHILSRLEIHLICNVLPDHHLAASSALDTHSIGDVRNLIFGGRRTTPATIDVVAVSVIVALIYTRFNLVIV